LQQSDDPVGRDKALDIGLELQLNNPYLQALLVDEPSITASWTAPATMPSEALSDLTWDEDMYLECVWDQ
jgi:predicted oxidoreductase (fatty acid repression mutant protein)